MTTTARDVIAALEKITGPDRVTDGAIQRLLAGRTLHVGVAGLTNAFTGSIDAALMLVPVNHTWWVDSEEVLGDGSTLPPSAAVKPYGADFRICDNSKGATPAIAMCIAALRARDAMSP